MAGKMPQQGARIMGARGVDFRVPSLLLIASDQEAIRTGGDWNTKPIEKRDVR
jgi:hypothetical protein